MNLEYLLQCPECKKVSFDRTRWYSTAEIAQYEYLHNNDRILKVYCQDCGDFYLKEYGLIGVKL